MPAPTRGFSSKTCCDKCRWDRPSNFVVCQVSRKHSTLTDDQRRSSIPPSAGGVVLPAGPGLLFRFHQVRENIVDACQVAFALGPQPIEDLDRKSTRLNSSHLG